jgi:hypothetical protein
VRIAAQEVDSSHLGHITKTVAPWAHGARIDLVRFAKRNLKPVSF